MQMTKDIPVTETAVIVTIFVASRLNKTNINENLSCYKGSVKIKIKRYIKVKRFCSEIKKIRNQKTTKEDTPE